jgi:hypothetical protein
MRNAILGIVGVIAASGACYWNESRLHRNDAMRKIPEAIKEACTKYTFKPTFAELESELNWFTAWECLRIAVESHREQFVAELNKQMKAASNGL